MAQPSESEATRPTRFSPARVLIAVIPAVIVAVAAYLLFPVGAATPDEQRIRRVFRLQPVQNQLDARFTDADRDLVADPPADPAAWIEPDPLIFSYIPGGEGQDYAAAWRPLVDELARATGRAVAYRTFASTEEQLRALKAGELHVAGLNTGAVPIAVNDAGFVPVATLGAADGPQVYRMQIIVRADSNIRAVDDLRGRELALTEPSSNSGYKAPLVILSSDFGLLPEQDFTVVHSYGHPASIHGVAEGRYAAAAVAGDLLQRMAEQGEVDADAVRVIYESEPFPQAGLGYLHRLAPELAERVRQALVGFEFAGTALAEEYAGTSVNRLVAVDYQRDWTMIRRIDNAIGYRHQIASTASADAE